MSQATVLPQGTQRLEYRNNIYITVHTVTIKTFLRYNCLILLNQLPHLLFLP